MRYNIVIYKDEGVGEFSLSSLLRFFTDDAVTLANANDLIDRNALDGADLFVMPGGADLPYCKKLNGAGNTHIRAFVEKGGTYLGICAGAYYACRDIEFHKGRKDEICGPRELAFVPATAIGSLPDLAPYYDDTLHSAAIIWITLIDGTKAQAFYHGGLYFKLDDAHNAQILARYDDIMGAPPAIIKTKVGKGVVILSGVHFEIGVGELSFYPTDDREELLHALALARKFEPSGLKNWKEILFKK